MSDTILIVVGLAIVVGMYVGAGWLADHIRVVIAGLSVVACIAILGVLVAKLIAGPKS